MAWQTVDTALEQRGINWMISNLGGFRILSPAGAGAAVAAIAVDELFGIFSRFTRVILGQLTGETMGAVALATSLINAAGGNIPTSFRGAVIRTIAGMLKDRTQLDIAKAAVTKTLRANGWRPASQSEASARQYIADEEAARGILNPQLRETYRRHGHTLRDVEALLEDARSHQGEDARLDESIPKLEKAVRMMRENQAITAGGRYDQESWRAAKGEAFRVGYGRLSKNPLALRGTQRKGGVAARLRHLMIKARRKCLADAKMSIAITRRGLRTLTRGIGGKASWADVVFGYQAMMWMLEQATATPTHQRVAYTERERGTDTIELKSVGTDPKPVGQPAGERRKYGMVGKGAERHWALLPGVEDEDSGLTGNPNTVSEPILKEARRRLDNNLGDFK